MAIKLGINGFGRIGRLVFRAAYSNPNIEVVSINDLFDADYLAYMLKFDSTHGKFPGEVSCENGAIIVDGKRVNITNEKDPANIGWGALGVDYVVESTGFFLTPELAGKHIEAGAKQVVISAPGKDGVPTYVMGVNNDKYNPNEKVVSNASCSITLYSSVCISFVLPQMVLFNISGMGTSVLKLNSPSLLMQ